MHDGLILCHQLLAPFCHFRVLCLENCFLLQLAAIIAFGHLLISLYAGQLSPLPHLFQSLNWRFVGRRMEVHALGLYIDEEKSSELLFSCCISLIQEICQPFSTSGKCSPGCDSFIMFLMLFQPTPPCCSGFFCLPRSYLTIPLPC